MEELRLQEKQKKKQNPFDPKGLRGTIYMLLHDMVCILAVITVLFVFAARLVGVYGSSMYPTLVGAQESDGTLGDYLVLRSNFLSGQYTQGDIVVACVPSFENGKPIVKRVVAVGGQTDPSRLTSAAISTSTWTGTWPRRPKSSSPWRLGAWARMALPSTCPRAATS